ncbi:EAL domain-containing protein [Massilia sp. 9096]|uniref:GGDEF/EAL domain-containing response regulator n=1 Tax=Massilia sp. 9096 TaxID=1500894 RepID=UPI00068A0F9E|nr:EAL domain-containing protein [Massilia sp. 9096]
MLDILVVEDSPTQAQHLVRLLAGEPLWRTRVAPDGLRALDAVRVRRPDLVISDVAMPGMDGYTLCRTLKAEPGAAALPVMLLTTLSTLEDIVRALEAGADGFLSKPYDPQQLRERVRRMLDERARGVPAGALEFMPAQRRQVLDLLVSTHDAVVRANAELAAQQDGLRRMVGTLDLLGRVAGALNVAASEAAVAQAVVAHLLELPALRGAALSGARPDGALRLVAGQGLAPGPGCPDCTHCGANGNLCLPLQAGGRRVGMLHVAPAGTAALAPEHSRLLDGIAAQVAAALARVGMTARLEALVVERTEALRSEKNRLSAVVDTAGALVLLADPDGRIVMFNRACEESLGWPACEAIGRPAWEVLLGGAAEADEEGDEGHAVRAVFDALRAGRVPPQLHGQWRTRDGRLRTIMWTNTALTHADGSVEYLLGTGIDVTELRGAEERVRYMSQFDALTGLPNRLLLRDRVRQMESQVQARIEAPARPDGVVLGFMLLRFGRMPLIREALGPLAEQSVLQQAAQRLREQGGSDAVGRFSEDAFALAALRRDGDELGQLARRMLAALGAPYLYDGEELHLDPSIGIAIYPNDGPDFESLVRGAEAALRLTFESVDQRYAFYRPELNRDANDRFRLETALRRAIERGELVLYYQPQVDLNSGRIVGAEALVRWQHPERGLIAPGTFIALAEESGLIMPLGEWVLARACAQLRDWQEAGLPLVPISVNLSALQFSEQIVGALRRILDECGIDPGLIELELTETASMADAGRSCELLAQLKAMGVHLAIDDFGTGYSNLNYLKRFPVDKLKLDQSFVRDILNDGDDLAISRAVVAMAHGLRLTVVAEGVECAGQLELLASLGCDLVQGYLFSPPVPAEAFARLLVDGPLGQRGPRTAS